MAEEEKLNENQEPLSREDQQGQFDDLFETLFNTKAYPKPGIPEGMNGERSQVPDPMNLSGFDPANPFEIPGMNREQPFNLYGGQPELDVMPELSEWTKEDPLHTIYSDVLSNVTLEDERKPLHSPVPQWGEDSTEPQKTSVKTKKKKKPVYEDGNEEEIESGGFFKTLSALLFPDDEDDYLVSPPKKQSKSVRKQAKSGKKRAEGNKGRETDEKRSEDTTEPLESIAEAGASMAGASKEKKRPIGKKAAKRPAADLEIEEVDDNGKETAPVKPKLPIFKLFHKKSFKNQEKATASKSKAIKPRTIREEVKHPIGKGRIAVVGLFMGTLVFVILGGTNVFRYQQDVTEAEYLLSQQKYNEAYQQISGVNMKQEDEELSGQIYCVMYVKKQLDTYYSYSRTGYRLYALDALIKGVDAYDRNIKQGRKLAVGSDMDTLLNEIETKLQKGFGLSLNDARAYRKLSQADYIEKLIQLTSENMK